MFFYIGALKHVVRACNFVKKRLQKRCFPAELDKFLRAFLTERLRLLLLKLLFLFYVEKYFRIKKKRRQKLVTLLINQVIFSFKMKNYASFAEINIIFITIPKAQLLNSLYLLFIEKSYSY